MRLLPRFSAVADGVDSPRGVSHIIGAGAFVTMLLLWNLVPRLIPVVIFEEGNKIIVTSEYVEMSVSAYKIRDCDPVLPIVKEVERDGLEVIFHRAEVQGANGRWMETLVEFVDDETPTSSRTPSRWNRIEFDRWRFYTPKRLPDPPLAARLPMAHLCGEHREVAVRTVLNFPIPLDSRQGKAVRHTSEVTLPEEIVLPADRVIMTGEVAR